MGQLMDRENERICLDIHNSGWGQGDLSQCRRPVLWQWHLCQSSSTCTQSLHSCPVLSHGSMINQSINRNRPITSQYTQQRP